MSYTIILFGSQGVLSNLQHICNYLHNRGALITISYDPKVDREHLFWCVHYSSALSALHRVKSHFSLDSTSVWYFYAGTQWRYSFSMIARDLKPVTMHDLHITVKVWCKFQDGQPWLSCAGQVHFSHLACPSTQYCLHLLVNNLEIPNPVHHIHSGSGRVPFPPDFIVCHRV